MSYSAHSRHFYCKWNWKWPSNCQTTQHGTVAKLSAQTRSFPIWINKIKDKKLKWLTRCFITIVQMVGPKHGAQRFRVTMHIILVLGASVRPHRALSTLQKQRKKKHPNKNNSIKKQWHNHTHDWSCSHILFHSLFGICWAISGGYASGLCVGHDWERACWRRMNFCGFDCGCWGSCWPLKLFRS